MVVVFAVPAFGATIIAPNLGSAFPFGLLGGTLSNTGVSLIVGDVGATIGLTGFPPGGPAIVTGTTYAGGPIATAAYNDFILAFDHAFSDAPTGTPVTQTVADLTTSQTFLGDNVYKFSSTDVTSTAGITLTFHAQFSSSDVFIIKIAHDLQINAPITFVLENGAQASNIYWIIGRDATISGATAVLPVNWEGDILAGRNFTMSAGDGGSGPLAGEIDGCVFVETTATLGGQTIINGCTPEPGPSGLVAFGCCLLGALGLRKFRSVRQTR
jgi:hypothetical protein